MRFRIALVAACLAVCSIGMCQDVDLTSGNFLLECIKSSEKGASEKTLSDSYIEGVFHGATDATRIFAEKLGVNSPNGVSTGQCIRIIKKFLNEHPERLHEHYLVLILDALLEAFGPYPPPK